MYRKADIFLKEISIETDESIWPYNKTEIVKLPLLDYSEMREEFELNNPTDEYAKFYFRRSKFTTVYHRSF